MEKKIENKCESIMQFGDDFGDNHCTFHCQLEKNHQGKHREEGVMYEEYPYVVEWEVDMTEKISEDEEMSEGMDVLEEVKYGSLFFAGKIRRNKMGMYTGLRVRAKIKPKYHKMIENVMKNRGWEKSKNLIAKNWNKWDRACFIPFGAICYLDWDSDDPKWKTKFEDGIWQFQCSLKNYGGEIPAFLDIVLSKITEELYVCESQYEEVDIPTQYELRDGKIIVKKETLEERLKKIGKVEKEKYGF